MKSSINFFSDKLLLGYTNGSFSCQLSKMIFRCGIDVDCVIIKGSDAKNLNINFSEIRNQIIFICVEDDLRKYNDILDKICSTYEIIRTANQNAIISFRGKEILPSDLVYKDNLFNMPEDAQILTCRESLCPISMFCVRDNYVVLMPNNAKEEQINEIEKCLMERYSINRKIETLKTFGISKSEIALLLNGMATDEVKIDIFEYLLECEIVISGSPEKSAQISSILYNIYNKLDKYVYLLNDLSADKVVLQLLKSSNKTLSTAESMTGGALISALIKNNEGAGKFIKEGVTCYSCHSKQTRFNIPKEMISEFGAVSSEVAYEMALNSLQYAATDLSVSVTGYASTADTEKNKGLCYIGIGDKDAIHIYKNYFKGSREMVIEQACQACKYYLIKKLRQKDFNFDSNDV